MHNDSFAARSELRKVLFLAPSGCGFLNRTQAAEWAENTVFVPDDLDF